MKKTVVTAVLAILAVNSLCAAQEGETIDPVVQQYLEAQAGSEGKEDNDIHCVECSGQIWYKFI